MPAFTPKFSLPKFDLPKFDIPKFDIPGIDLTHFDVKKNIETARKNAERLVNFTKDAAYVTVGSGVLTMQQVQVRRRELTASIQARIPSSLGDVSAAGAAVSAKGAALVNTAKDVAEKVAANAAKALTDTVVSVRSRIAPSA
jgi:hypothetical protein